MSAIAKLRLATLEDMENHPPSQPMRSQGQSRGLGAAPAKKAIRNHSHVGQIKYNLTGEQSLTDRIAFKAYLGIFRWFKKHFNFITPTHQKVNPDGSITYGWLEHQGCFEDEESAKQDAARYEYGFVVPVPVGRSLPSDTIEGDYEFPNKEGALGMIKRELTEIVFIREEAQKLKETVNSVRMIQ